MNAYALIMLAVATIELCAGFWLALRAKEDLDDAARHLRRAMSLIDEARRLNRETERPLS